VIQVENRLYKPREVAQIMGIDRVSFWRAFKRVKPTPVQVTGPKQIRLYPEAVRQLVEFFTVRAETRAADLKRIADLRRKS
jgi:predicted DNA-binding transcriptional regulator AlpA